MKIIPNTKIYCVGQMKDFNFIADEVSYLLAGDFIVCEAVS